jgi:hypothetical protein
MPTAMQNGHADLLRSFSISLGDAAGWLIAGALASGALWALLGAVAGLAAMVLIWRRSLLRRRPAVWNVLAKLSYLFLLVAFIGAAAGFGAVRKVQNNFESMLNEQMQPALTTKMPSIREYLAARISRYAPDRRTAKDVLADFIEDLRYVPTTDTRWERLKANCVNWLIRKFGTELFVHQFRKLVVIKLEALGSAMKTDMRGQAQGQLVHLGADLLVKLGTDATRNVDYAMLDKTVPQALVEVVQKTADGYFNTAYKMIGIILGAVLLAVGAEMTVYFKWYLPKRAGVSAD